MSNQIGFNYDIVKDAKLRTEAKKQADQINKLLRTSTEAVVEIGKRLNGIREGMLATPKLFRAWIECEFCWQQSTAANYMQTARVFGELDCLAKFQPSAIIMLARTNIPAKISEAMIERARAGETITYTIVKKALSEDASFQPTRRDAGVSRKGESKGSTVNAASAQTVPVTIEALQKSLDAFSASLPLLTLEQSDRDVLANRFFELACELRTLQPKATPKESPASPKAKVGKPRGAKTAA